jgi:hypothetical protein
LVDWLVGWLVDWFWMSHLLFCYHVLAKILYCITPYTHHNCENLLARTLIANKSCKLKKVYTAVDRHLPYNSAWIDTSKNANN